jgi:hypothetical protein
MDLCNYLILVGRLKARRVIDEPALESMTARQLVVWACNHAAHSGMTACTK